MGLLTRVAESIAQHNPVTRNASISDRSTINDTQRIAGLLAEIAESIVQLSTIGCDATMAADLGPLGQDGREHCAARHRQPQRHNQCLRQGWQCQLSLTFLAEMTARTMQRMPSLAWSRPQCSTAPSPTEPRSCLRQKWRMAAVTEPHGRDYGEDIAAIAITCMAESTEQ